MFCLEEWPATGDKIDHLFIQICIINEEVIHYAAVLFRKRGLVAFPTDTVYGLGVDGFNPEAVERLFLAKERPIDKPLAFLVKDTEGAGQLASQTPPVFERLTLYFWPGPLTLVLPASRDIPPIALSGKESVGVRMPDEEVALDLIKEFGRPIATTSANLSSFPPPFTSEEVLDSLEGKIDLIIDCGRTKGKDVSTVIDLISEELFLIRKGGISWERCLEVIRGGE